MRQVIADAATRRATVTRGCASGTDRSRSIVEETAKTGFRTKADEEDANEEAIMQAYIDLIQEEEMEKYGANYVPASRENPAGSQGASQSAPPPVLDSLVPPPPRRPSPPSVPSSTKPLPAGSWACDICTLVNPTTYLCCDACGTERPDSSFPTLPSTTSTTSSSSSSFSSPSPSLLRKPNRNPTPQSSLRNNYSSSSNSNTTSSRSNPRFHQEPTPPKTKPLGWLCHQCGNWMESEWWTCAECGSMKLSS